MVVRIRQATIDEAEVIGSLTVDAYRDHVASDYLAELRDAGSRIRDAEVLVAVLDDAIVGAVTVAPPGNPYAEISRADELEVRMLAVAEVARGKGIAASLMDAVEARAMELELAAVVLCTAPTMHAAHRLYERRGYQRQPERDWFVPEEDFTLLTYRLDLTS
jgi:ribosomal protein S18 acetylase RimI-like enzyme